MDRAPCKVTDNVGSVDVHLVYLQAKINIRHRLFVCVIEIFLHVILFLRFNFLFVGISVAD